MIRHWVIFANIIKLTREYLDVIIYSKVELRAAYWADWNEVYSFWVPSLRRTLYASPGKMERKQKKKVINNQQQLNLDDQLGWNFNYNFIKLNTHSKLLSAVKRALITVANVISGWKFHKKKIVSVFSVVAYSWKRPRWWIGKMVKLDTCELGMSQFLSLLLADITRSLSEREREVGLWTV